MNRREFLRNTAAAGAAVVAAPLVALAGPEYDVYPIHKIGATRHGGTTPLSGKRPCSYEEIVRETMRQYRAFYGRNAGRPYLLGPTGGDAPCS